MAQNPINTFSRFYNEYGKTKNKKLLLNNFLNYCFINKKVDDMKSIIDKFKLDNKKILIFNKKNLSFKISLVSISVLWNDKDFVEYVLNTNHKYDINSDYSSYYSQRNSFLKFENLTPLFIAVKYTKNREIIDLLIQYGADINAKNFTKSIAFINIKFKNHVTNEERNAYYDFLISRGANINEQDISGNTALNYTIIENNFDVALHLINKCGANPRLLNKNMRNGFMEFIINLNRSDYHNGNNWVISPPYNTKIEYVEKLLLITNNEEEKNEIYDLFAACIKNNPFLKANYFNKVKKYKTLHNDLNSRHYRQKFNLIVRNDMDNDLYIPSVKVFNRLLNFYDYDTVINMILNIINFYEFVRIDYDKCFELFQYVLDVVTDNIEKINIYYKISANFVYATLFYKYISFVLRNFPTLNFKNILSTYQNMMYNLIKIKAILDNDENNYSYNLLIMYIHEFTFYIYKYYFYQEYERNEIEFFISSESYLNLLDKNNQCILHNFLKDKTVFIQENYVDEIIINFLNYIIKKCNFIHLTKRDSINNQTPLSLAIQYNRNEEIIKILFNSDIVKYVNNREISDRKSVV